ncbi:MAG TPA: RNA methyltransferase [Caulobacteraceae bacterium]|nr:RNA methyltransferase [Caulobacteraceae bacterium]
MLALTIEAMGAKGEGIATGPIYVPLALPGERLMATVAGRRGALECILQSSPERVAPVCPHFGDCGGCALQHWRDDAIGAWKRARIEEALARAGVGGEVLEPMTVAAHERRRVALHARQDGGDIRLGFKAARSWRLVDVGVCMVADERIVAALPALRALAAALFDHPLSAPSLHVTATDSGLDVDVTGIERRSGGLPGDARVRAAALARAADLARLTLAGEVLFLARAPTVRLTGVPVVLPPGAFLQACSSAERAITDFIVARAAGSRRIVDLYCGVGTFSLPLARLAPVWAADSSAASVAALAAASSWPGLKPVRAEVRDLDRRPILARDIKVGDTVIFDPPRAGAAAQAAQLARSPASTIIAVSCNPATFARDAAILGEAGWRAGPTLPVDQFRWSAHIELVAAFYRRSASS